MLPYQRIIPYILWFLIVILTNYFFSIFSKKTKSTSKVLIGVFLPVWLIITLVKIVCDIIYLNEFNISLVAFIGQLIQNIPQVVIIGGIAFFVQYRKFKKTI